MEVSVELDERLVEELEDEANLQGFDDLGAYMRWIVAHRPMSELASTEAAAVASRVSELEERLKVVERQLDLDGPVNPDADLGGSTSGGSLESGAGGTNLDPGSGSDEAVDLADPTPDDEEDAAEDDEIAEALENVSLDDEDEEG